MRILVAEDDLVTRRVLANAVAHLGHEPVEAEDGEAAWERLQADAIDVVISDWLMPRVDGAELCRRVRAAQDRPYVYFIFLSVLEDLEHALVGMRAGADDYLTKPLRQDDLQARLIAAERVTALHRRLRRREAERERTLCRREAMLRVARRLAADGDAQHMLGQLLAEAVATLDVDAASVYARDEKSGVLVRLSGTGESADATDGGASEAAALAIERREPAIVMGRASLGGGAGARGDGLRATIAAPLLHEGAILGALEVSCDDDRRAFDAEDLEMLELLAGVASAALVGLERAQLKGVMLASRTIQHELNNHLAVASGYAECLAADPDLPPHLRELADLSVQGVMQAAEVLARLQRVTRIQEMRWGKRAPSTLDLAASGA